MKIERETALVGCLLGGAVGDALGLPYEGLSPGRARRMLGAPDRYRLLGRWGMVSDDTEHACMTAHAYLAAKGDVRRFENSLAWRLRFWFLGLPAGIGLATLRAIIKLWIGFDARKSGVYSAGNGPAMRASVLGVAINDTMQLRIFVRAATRITHTDPKAEHGAFAIALAAHFSSRQDSISASEYLATLEHELGDPGRECTEVVRHAISCVDTGMSTLDFARSIGLEKGVTGYMFHTLPVVIHAWLSHPNDFSSALIAIIKCGGDTDTAAAILGGIVGARVGKAGIPVQWLAGLRDWPRSANRIERCGIELASDGSSGHASINMVTFAVAALVRNTVFMLIVLIHGFRRLLPPY